MRADLVVEGDKVKILYWCVLFIVTSTTTLLFVGVANAQTAVNTSKIAWTQEAPTLADAQGYTYRYYPDGAPGVALSGVTCSGEGSPFSCQVAFPAFTPGNHALTMTAANLAGESVQSAPLNFVFVVTPATPTGLRIVP